MTKDKLKHRVLTMLLTLCMIVGMNPLSILTAFAETPSPTIGGGILVDRTSTDGEAAIYFEALNVPANSKVTVKLYAGDKYLTYKEKTFTNGGTIGCSFYTVGTSSSWKQDEWTAYDNVVPTKAVMYINDQEVATSGVRFTNEEWVAFPGTEPPKEQDTSNPGASNPDTSNPATDDSINIILWFTMLIMSITGLAATAFYKKRVR